MSRATIRVPEVGICPQTKKECIYLACTGRHCERKAPSPLKWKPSREPSLKGSPDPVSTKKTSSTNNPKQSKPKKERKQS